VEYALTVIDVHDEGNAMCRSATESAKYWKISQCPKTGHPVILLCFGNLLYLI